MGEHQVPAAAGGPGVQGRGVGLALSLWVALPGPQVGGQVISKAGPDLGGNLQNSAFICREQLMGLSFLLFSAQRRRLWSKNLEYAFKLCFALETPGQLK